MSEQYVRGLQ